MSEQESSDISLLPEGCISTILSLTSPGDAGRAAAVSTAFRSAAASDIVWDRFLPKDYPSILAAASSPLHYNSKSQLFLRLCDRPLLIHNGRMSFQLDKRSGAKCYMLSARELTIIWSSTPQYWKWIQHPNSRFSEVAELLGVCWLEIRGKIESKLLTKETTYVAYLVYRGGDTPDFQRPLQEAIVKLGAQLSELKVSVYHNSEISESSEARPWHRGLSFRRWGRQSVPVNQLTANQAQPDRKVPRLRDDKWMEVELGEFYNDAGEDGEVNISFLEIKGGHWKGGLIVEGIEVRPKRST